MKYEFIVTPEELLRKVGPVNWFRDQDGTEAATMNWKKHTIPRQ